MQTFIQCATETSSGCIWERGTDAICGMSTSTIGFAVADEDRERLGRLVAQFGGGNRSAFLRATFPVMEALARSERLRELQARNADRAAEAGQDYESLLAEVKKSYKGGKKKR